MCERISYKFRLYPTHDQERRFEETLETCRRLYNRFLAERKEAWEERGESINYHAQAVSLPVLKQTNPYLSDVHSQVLQNVAKRIDLAFQAFFRRVKQGEKAGYPRFRGKGWYDSLTFPQYGNGCRVMGNLLTLSKIGDVRMVLHRPIIGNPKTITIRRQNDKWFACISCEIESAPLPASEEKVGIDVGLEKFAALSDGSFIENPRFFRKDEKALAKAQRCLSKCVKGTPARKKARKFVSRIHERIRNRRHNFVHQNARKIVNRFGFIAVEDLNVQGMQGNHCLAKSIADAAWSMFRLVLSEKAASAARRIVAVDPAYTSQDCSGCGHRQRKSLRERWYLCPECGLSMDRDTNAALNILKVAVGLYSVAA